MCLPANVVVIVMSLDLVGIAGFADCLQSNLGFRVDGVPTAKMDAVISVLVGLDSMCAGSILTQMQMCAIAVLRGTMDLSRGML